MALVDCARPGRAVRGETSPRARVSHRRRNDQEHDDPRNPGDLEHHDDEADNKQRDGQLPRDPAEVVEQSESWATVRLLGRFGGPDLPRRASILPETDAPGWIPSGYVDEMGAGIVLGEVPGV